MWIRLGLCVATSRPPDGYEGGPGRAGRNVRHDSGAGRDDPTRMGECERRDDPRQRQRRRCPGGDRIPDPGRRRPSRGSGAPRCRLGPVQRSDARRDDPARAPTPVVNTTSDVPSTITFDPVTTTALKLDMTSRSPDDPTTGNLMISELTFPIGGGRTARARLESARSPSRWLAGARPGIRAAETGSISRALARRDALGNSSRSEHGGTPTSQPMNVAGAGPAPCRPRHPGAASAAVGRPRHRG